MLAEEVVNNINQKHPFVFYRLPGAQKIQALVQESPEILNFNPKNDRQGFIIAPFTIKRPEDVLLIQGNGFELDQDSAFFEKLTQPRISTAFDQPVWDLQQYLKKAGELIGLLKSGEIEKAILSRIKTSDKLPDFSFFKCFQELCLRYPEAFVYCFHLPGRGSWMGASPETLVDFEAGKLKTVALAGTQESPGDDWERASWGIKEKQEQALVSDYVEKILRQGSLGEIIKRGPFSTRAGKMLHLKTEFESRVEAEKLLEVTLKLHPTPAVCGIPLEASKKAIGQIESHDRDFYAGFLGPFNLNESRARFFVNLRCMQVFERELALYLGGGLTRLSEAEKEWEETELKSLTLLNVLEGL